MPVRSDLSIMAVGAVAGLAAGLLGVGGGIVMVPGLVIVAHLAQKRAHAASLAAIIPIGVVGASTYLLRGDIHFVLAAFLAIGSVAGAPLGVRALERIPERVLRPVFVVVAVVVAVRLLIERAADAAPLPPQSIEWTHAIIAVLVGVAAGAFAGLLGVGGGIIIVPAMTVFLEQGQHVSQGTSLLVIIATAIAATQASARRGLVDVRTAALLGTAGAIAAAAGAILAGSLGDVTLRRAFGIFLAAVALRLLVQGRKPADAATDIP